MTRPDEASAGACSFRADSSSAREQCSRALAAQGKRNNGGLASPRSPPRGRSWRVGGKTERRCGGFDKSTRCSLGPTCKIGLSCFGILIMSSKMKVASQHWTDWTDWTDCTKQNKRHFYTVKIEKIFIHDSRV